MSHLKYHFNPEDVKGCANPHVDGVVNMAIPDCFYGADFSKVKLAGNLYCRGSNIREDILLREMTIGEDLVLDTLYAGCGARIVLTNTTIMGEVKIDYIQGYLELFLDNTTVEGKMSS